MLRALPALAPGKMEGSTLLKLIKEMRHLVHVCCESHRHRKVMQERMAKFAQKKAEQGAMAASASFEDYLAAREQTGCNIAEYFLFQFYKKDSAERDTYLTYERRDSIIRRINDDQTSNATVPGNKVLFNMLFDKYLAREWINPTSATPEAFAAFVKKHGKVMLKPACDGKGHGISIYEYTTDEEARALHDRLVGASMLVEEVLRQHPALNEINPNCINTVRVATYTDRYDEHILLATLRTARGVSIVDNFDAGGIHVAVDLATGKLCSNATDEQMHDYPTHPLTGTKLNGFQLPNWDKALDVLHRASREMYALPGCRYLGWDIAFLENGEIAIVECNWRQGPQAQQPHPHGYYHELMAASQKL